MKKLLLILLCLPLLFTTCKKETEEIEEAKTYVPDDNFEAYLEDNGMGDGIANNNYVLTSQLNAYVSPLLNISGLEISDLTGIEEFINISWLQCSDNQLTSLDVSKNTALTMLHCYGNNITHLDLKENTMLQTLHCYDNQLQSLNLTNCTLLKTLWAHNNNLTLFGVLDNPLLETLWVQNNNLEFLNLNYHPLLVELNCRQNNLQSLSLIHCINLTNFSCQNNQLTYLNIKNGNNQNIISFLPDGNWNLTCIGVDNESWNWPLIQSNQYFSEDCP